MAKDESRLVLPNRMDTLHPLLGFVREKAAALGFSPKEIRSIELTLEEAVVNVLQHAYQPGEEAAYEVTVARAPGRLVIGVEDHGLPYDLKAAGKGLLPGLGLRLAGAFADELRFVNLGRGGKRVEFVKNLPAKDVGDYLTEEDRGGATETPAPSGEEFEIRSARAEDAVAMSRCLYRTYGYSDPRDFMYYPERFAETLASGLVESRVAVTPDGEVAGAWFISRSAAGASVGETGRGIVDPRFRGRHLFETIVGQLLEGVRRQGMFGLVTRPVTNHPFSQKALIPYGAAVTAILLAYAPETLVFRAIGGERLPHRLTVLSEYLKLADGPRRTVHAPLHHAGMVRRIFEGAGLARDYAAAVAPGSLPVLPGEARVDVHALPEIGHAHITVAEYGADGLDRVRHALEQVLSAGMPVVYLDLPLGLPWTAPFCARFEALGFFFAGVVPDLYGGDMLTLQHLPDQCVDRARIEIVSPFGKELLDYVWTGWQGHAPGTAMPGR